MHVPTKSLISLLWLNRNKPTVSNVPFSPLHTKIRGEEESCKCSFSQVFPSLTWRIKIREQWGVRPFAQSDGANKLKIIALLSRCQYKYILTSSNFSTTYIYSPRAQGCSSFKAGRERLAFGSVWKTLPITDRGQDGGSFREEQYWCCVVYNK